MASSCLEKKLCKHPSSLFLTSFLKVPYADLESYSVLWLVAKHGLRPEAPDGCPKPYVIFLLFPIGPDRPFIS